ncbi:MAG: SMC-Scp complex subunit ScpB [Planctomycetes bacterium]|nr:SMC-Scp complex subunit ScpB [Planctomycetota bacterium]
MSMAEDDDPQDDSFWGQLDQPAEAADWAGDELEEAYLRAMEVLEASDAQFPDLPPVPVPSNDLDVQDATSDSDPAGSWNAPADVFPDRIEPSVLQAELTELSDDTARRQDSAPKAITAVTPRQILEALLFVGGEPLTTRKMSNVLRGEFSAEYIEALLDELNSLYSREGRPYEVRLGEGGYRLTLREEFERIRRKSYGLGPKEVKLSQEAIEVLAIVAYHQPTTAAAVEERGKPGCGAVLRQLLRRELIAVERTAGKQREVVYRTTPRFLSLFGIRSLNELPRLEQVAYK